MSPPSNGRTRKALLKRRAKITALLLSLGLIATLLTAWLMGSALCAPVNRSVGSLPHDLPGRAVHFPSRSGSEIQGWVVPGKKGMGAVLLLHGLRGNRQDMLSRAQFLSRAGYSLLLIDFQAHGESHGKQITFGYLESRDVEAAVQFATQSFPGERIGVIGVSLGGAATLLAGPLPKVDALVLEMVYPSIDEAITDRLAIRLGWCAPLLTPLLSRQIGLRFGIASDRLRPIDHVAHLTTPKLFIVGAEDRHTPLAESRRMFAAASVPKELWVVEGAHHMDLHVKAPEEYERRVLTFFGERVGSRARLFGVR